MTDRAVIHTGENSPEFVAYRLLQNIAFVEKKLIAGVSGASSTADRKWILDTYAECLNTVHNPAYRLRHT